MFCQTCKREMTLSMMPCPICDAKSLSDINMSGEYFEMKMEKPYMAAPLNDVNYKERATDKMMHGEVTDAIDDEITSQFTVSVDDLKSRHTEPPSDDMKFYAGDDDEDDALTHK